MVDPVPLPHDSFTLAPGAEHGTTEEAHGPHGLARINLVQARQLVMLLELERPDAVLTLGNLPHAGPGLYAWCEAEAFRGASLLSPDD